MRTGGVWGRGGGGDPEESLERDPDLQEWSKSCTSRGRPFCLQIRNLHVGAARPCTREAHVGTLSS